MHLISKGKLQVIIRVDGYRDAGKKILKISICVPDLDFSNNSDYNNFPWALVEVDESVESFEAVLKDLTVQVIIFLKCWFIFLSSIYTNSHILYEFILNLQREFLKEHGLDFGVGQNIKISLKLVTDLLAFWYIFGEEFGWQKDKFCTYCNQMCDATVIGPSSGIITKMKRK